jgi:hypothetical protein
MMRRRVLLAGCLGGLVLLLTACAGTLAPTESSGPGVPRILNLRFEPDTVAVGQVATMSFYFEVGSADLDEGFLLERGIADFQLFTSLQSTPIDLRRYRGQVAATVEVPIRWSTEGVRFVEVYVVSQKGHPSNRLNATVTVR